MVAYLKAVEDTLPTRSAGNWVAQKLDYLARYLDMFITSMRTPKQKWRALNYIDLFAGPGKCQSDNGKVHLGSPLLALTARKPFSHYFFVDLEPANLNALQQRAAATSQFTNCHFYTGDSNVIVHQIVARIQEINGTFIQGAWPCLNLAFLDPEGLELEWTTVATLAQLRTDLIIHYSQMGLERYMPIAIEKSEETVVDRFFGSREWREIYLKWHNKIGSHRQLIDFYKNNLKSLGYAEIKGDEEGWNEPLMRNTKNAPLYRLLFASKHELGEKFWRTVNQRDVHGQTRLF